MSDMKLCKDCRHFIDWNICHHPEARLIDEITGKSVKLARWERGMNWRAKCGPDAKLFEPKPPRRTFWQWLTGQQPA